MSLLSQRIDLKRYKYFIHNYIIMTEDSNYHLFDEEENNQATIVGYNLKYNLDEFLTGCYCYFRYKGFKNIIIYNFILFFLY